MIPAAEIKYWIIFCSLVLIPGSGSDIPDQEAFESCIKAMYHACRLDNKLGYDVFRLAVIGYTNMEADGILSNKQVITVIDYTRSGNDKRLYVIDLSQEKLLFHSLVAHGKNTGQEDAKHFANEPLSCQSSLGFFVTGETYTGKHGYSLKLDGMDTLFNDKARQREIVMHGAHYVSDEWAKKYGRIGRSWGCPAVPEDSAQAIINAIKDGCLLFAYYNNEKYLAAMKYLDINDEAIQNFMAKLYPGN